MVRSRWPNDRFSSKTKTYLGSNVTLRAFGLENLGSLLGMAFFPRTSIFFKITLSFLYKKDVLTVSDVSEVRVLKKDFLRARIALNL